MRFLKYAILTMVAAFVVNIALVNAYSSPYAKVLQLTLKGNNVQYTDYLTKTVYNYGKAQEYENIHNHTSLTSPCPNCEIRTILEAEGGGGTSSAYYSKMGETIKFDRPTSIMSDGNYRVNIKRNDFTLLDTEHVGNWVINQTV